MAEKVSIVLEAIDKASAEINKTQKSLLSLDVARSVFNGLSTAVRYFEQALNATVGAAVDYAREVQKLQQASGQTAEETSRMIQVFDDLTITTEQLNAVVRAMTQEGLTPNLETIAQLSDAYLALQTPLERNAFLMDNFGRAGLDMAKVMERGGDAIRGMSATVDEGLILSQEAEDAAIKYAEAVDNLQDSWHGLTVEMGNVAIPVLTDTVGGLQDVVDGLKAMGDIGSSGINKVYAAELKLKAGLITYQDFKKILDDTGASLETENWLLDRFRLQTHEAETATGDFGVTAEKSADQLRAEADAIAAVSDANKEFLSNVDSVQGAYDDFKTAVDEYHQELADVANDKTLTNDEKKEKIDEITEAFNKSREATERWVAEFIFAMAQANLAIGGLTDIETAQLLNLGESLGLIDPEVAAATERVMAAINSGDPTALNTALGDMEKLFDYDGETIDIDVKQDTTYQDSERGVTPVPVAAVQSVSTTVEDINSIDPAAADTVERLTEAITKVDPTQIEEALARMKELIALNGTTVTVTVNQVTAPAASAAPLAPSGGTETAPGGFGNKGITINSYGTINMPSSADSLSLMDALL